MFLISRVLPLRAGLRATRNQKHFRPICDKLLEEDQGSCALNRLTTEGDRLEEKVIAMRELLFRAVRFAGLLMCLAVLCRESAEAQLYNGKELVRPSLIADVDSIQPGQKFRVGVLYRIEPGWHIYWRYSGDSGIPTKIQWQFPEGFKVHDLQWPLPLRDKEPGDLEVFGYVSEVLLFADVEAPASR